MNAFNDEKKKVTIYSVAHEAGVSLATVSRVINDSSLVKADTKKKVQEAIAKLGYRPNAVAQGLALKKTTTIALVIPDTSFLYIGKIINGLLDVAKIYKYNIMLHTSSSSINEMDEIVDNIVKSRADGVIVYNDYLTEKQVLTLSNFQVPIVYVGHDKQSENSCNVYVDYKDAIYKLVTDYLDKGIDDIVLIEDKKNKLIIESLIDGVNKAFDEKGKKFNGFISIPDNFHNSYDYLNKYFADHTHKLVITLRDSQAMAVLNTCKENGIDIPKDTDLVCMMDSRYNEMARPTISSFVTPAYDLGALAMRVMTKMLSDDEIMQREYQLACIYHRKESTKY
ncbi:MAG: LacI family DNA-binding transcriptional regulator [Erysipelotrichia bacterium]|nr:LacI family DNA-binding transcriptional regulator [Erysipelotrichia bacterium]